MIQLDKTTKEDFDPIEASFDIYGQLTTDIWAMLIMNNNVRPKECPRELYVAVRNISNKFLKMRKKGQLVWSSIRTNKQGRRVGVTYNKKEYAEYLKMHEQRVQETQRGTVSQESDIHNEE